MNGRPPLTFLDLPTEIRQRIFHFAIPTQHLKAQQFLDPSWTSPEGPKGIPSLFCVNKALSEDAAAVFYSRAVLNVAPLRPPSYIFDTLDTPGHRVNLTFGLDVAFSACPRRHLQRITTSHVYSGQRDVINAEAYEGLLRWLADNTSVQTIFLSQRLMTRIRRARADFNATLRLCSLAPNLSLIRTIYIYSEHRRSQWEVTRISELRRALKGRGLPQVQTYLVESGGENDPLLDPRWDARSSDDDDRLANLDKIATWVDHLMAADSVVQQSSQLEGEDKHRLYQVCFVFEPSRPRQT